MVSVPGNEPTLTTPWSVPTFSCDMLICGFKHELVSRVASDAYAVCSGKSPKTKGKIKMAKVTFFNIVKPISKVIELYTTNLMLSIVIVFESKGNNNTIFILLLLRYLCSKKRNWF